MVTSIVHPTTFRRRDLEQGGQDVVFHSDTGPHHPNHHHMDYRCQNGPCLSLLWSEQEYHGQSLYLGGVEGLDGNIYCIPGNADRVLCIDPRTDRVYPIPEPVDSRHSQQRLLGKFKWLRGIRVGHIIYGLPCHSPTVLRIDTRTQHIQLLDIPYDSFYNDKIIAHEQRTMEWKYHGGSFSQSEGCIYAIPQSAWHVLRIDTNTDTCTLVPSEPLLGRYKWYGGVVGNDAAVYGIPHNAHSVLRIRHNAISLHGQYPDTHKWHGAAVAGDGTIVCVPANADFVLCIQPSLDPLLYEIHAPDLIQTGRHRKDGKYKYLGCTRGSNGKVYCFPSGSEYVLQVDTIARVVENVGANLVTMERMVQNKWQNGVKQGDFIYAIPLSAESVLRIDLAGATTKNGDHASQITPIVTTWRLPQPLSGLAKWEGAVSAALTTGAIYCMPNNHKAVLRIADSPSIVTDQLSPLTGILLQESKENADVFQAKLNVNHCPDPVVLTTEVDAEQIEASYKYTTGIPTLRSSAHRVKYSPKHRKATTENGRCLPLEICENLILDYDLNQFAFKEVLLSFLRQCDPSIVGVLSSNRLEDCQIPLSSLNRGANGGCCENAQSYLSDQLASFQPFMELFDRFVVQFILPHLKQRLLHQDKKCCTDHDGATTVSALCKPLKFYYQRPPTLRLQPGPARAHVKPHCDSEYGHQEGELNFWFPLTDRQLTGVDLHVECAKSMTKSACTSAGVADGSDDQRDKESGCVAVPVQVGQVLSFHGTSRRHFVNSNSTPFTRVSIDFRVGVEGYFDADWEMLGTTADHSRARVEV